MRLDMQLKRLLAPLLLAGASAAMLAPLIANHRPLVIRFAPHDYYASKFEEFQTVWVTEARSALDEAGNRGVPGKKETAPGERTSASRNAALEAFSREAESMAALVEGETADEVGKILALVNDGAVDGPSDSGRRYRLWGSAIDSVSGLLRPRPGLVARRWFFPAFHALRGVDLSLLIVLLMALVWFGVGRVGSHASRATASRRLSLIAASLIVATAMIYCKLNAGPAAADFAAPGQMPADSAAIWPPLPHSPETIDLQSKYSPPSRKHWLGTDSLGRDLLSRIIWGARVSLTIGILAVAVQLGLGTLLGGLAGMPVKWISPVFSRVIEGVISVPGMLLALIMLALTGPSFGALVLTVALTGCAPVAQMFRAELLRLRKADFVCVAWNLGLSRRRIFFLHLLPNAVTPLIGHIGYGLAAAILMESSLSFLGLGVQIPTPSWGGILSEARGQIHLWWLAAFPGLCIVMAVLLAQRLAEKVQQALAIRPGHV